MVDQMAITHLPLTSALLTWFNFNFNYCLSWNNFSETYFYSSRNVNWVSKKGNVNAMTKKTSIAFICLANNGTVSRNLQFLSLLLPRGFPTTPSPCYMTYFQWQAQLFSLHSKNLGSVSSPGFQLLTHPWPTHPLKLGRLNMNVSWSCGRRCCHLRLLCHLGHERTDSLRSSLNAILF